MRESARFSPLSLFGATLSLVLAIGAPASAQTTSWDLVDALGIDSAVVDDHGLEVVSGITPVPDADSALVIQAPQGGSVVLLSSGIADAQQLGDTDLLADDAPDCTTFWMSLGIPSGASFLRYDTTFATLTQPGNDFAQLRYTLRFPDTSESAGTIALGSVASASDVQGSQRSHRTRAGLALQSAETLELAFEVCDADDGDLDSTLVLSQLAFATAPTISSEDLAQALVLDPSLIQTHSLAVSSNSTPLGDAMTASADPSEHSVLLSTGIAEEAGVGDTDLGQDGLPDCSRLTLGLAVPAGAKSVLFSTQFVAAEYGSSSAANDLATVSHNASGPASPVVVGRSRTNSATFSRPVLRALDVEGLASVEIAFEVCDDQNGGVDSALKVSRLRFSERLDASVINQPREDRSKPSTGTYAYSKQLISVPGVSPAVSFNYTIYYDSAIEDQDVTLDCYMLFGFIPIVCIPYYDFYRTWTDTYAWAIEGGDEITVKRGDGTWEYFVRNGAAYEPKHAGNYSTLAPHPDGSFTYTTKDHIEYRFDSARRLVAIVDPDGNALTISHATNLRTIVDTRGNVATIRSFSGGTCPAGRSCIEVDYAGELHARVESERRSDETATWWDLVAATDPAGRTTAYYYLDHNEQHTLLTSVYNADGVRTVALAYDGRGRVTRTTDANGSSSTTHYTSNWAYYTDREGAQILKIFDLDDRPIYEQGPLGVEMTYEYDTQNNVVRKIDPRGVETEMDYDDKGNLVWSRDGTGNVTTMTYDAWDNRVSKQVARGADSFGSSFKYDEANHLISAEDPLGNEVHYTYTELGQLESATDRNGHVYQYVYGSGGDIWTATDPLGNITSYVHDRLGRKVSVRDANGNTTTSEYDAAGQLSAEIDALGRKTEYRRDGEGRVVTQIAPDGSVTTFNYTATGNLESVVDPLGIELRYEYDKESRQTRSIDPLGRSVSYAYDPAGRLVRVSVEDERGEVVNAATAEYDAAGNSTAITDPNGNTTTFEYDDLSRPLVETDPLGNRTVNEFDDPRGLLTAYTNARGQTIEHEYDDAGRMKRIEFADGTTIEHDLDPNGNRLLTLGRNLAKTARAFDALNRPVSRTDEFGNTIQYNYDSAGNLVTLTYSDGKTVYYGYDELNRLTSVTDWSGRTTSYGYDAAGNLASARSPDGSVVTYSYDASRRLIGVEDRDPAGEVIYRCQYTLNEAGLRIAEVVEAPLAPRAEVKPKHFAYNAANQLVSDGENDFYYDADGNMVEGAIGGATRTLVYDELNRLVSVGADEYRYDAEGVRIESRIGGGTVRNVYDPYGPFPRLLEQHDGNGRVIARYVYGLGLIGSENARTRDYSVYHFDSRGSTVATTDDSGHIRTRYAYDPYGRVVERRGPGNAQGAAYGAPWNPFTFAGRWGVVDDGNGLYKMGSRYYAPELMRFVHRDQQFSGKLSDPQSLNRYAYALGNPIHVIDPSGNYFILDDIIMSLIGVIVNMGSLLIGDLISGEWSSWLDYMGAFIGGIAWGETFLYTGNPLAAGFVSAAVESGWKMLTMLFASPWMFALTGETPNWEALGIQAGIEIGISTVLSIGGKAPSGLQKKFTAKAIAKAFGKPLWKVAVMKYVGGPAALLAKRAVTKGAGGAFKGFFIRGDRWGVRDHIPVVATSIVFMGALIPELVWDPLWP